MHLQIRIFSSCQFKKHYFNHKIKNINPFQTRSTSFLLWNLLSSVELHKEILEAVLSIHFDVIAMNGDGCFQASEMTKSTIK